MNNQITINTLLNQSLPYQVLVVDDDPAQRVLEKEILNSENFIVEEACNGQDALEKIKTGTFDAVLLDRKMPDMSGDEVCRQVRKTEGGQLIPIIMITGDSAENVMKKNFSGFVNDYIRKPYENDELIARVRSAVISKRKTDELENIESVLFSLSRVVETRCGETGDHCNRISGICTMFASELGLNDQDIHTLQQGSLLHDIGKISIPDSILMKKDRLTAEELTTMRKHTIYGYEICKSLKTLAPVLPIIRNHHELFDGSGYPDQLAGDEIPLTVRIFQLVDVYDALANKRSYKTAFSLEKIINILKSEKEMGWRDPELTDIFIDFLFRRHEEIQALFNDD